MKNLLTLTLLAAALLSPANAEDSGKKSELLQNFRNIFQSDVAAECGERLVVINASPEWWNQYLKTEKNQQGNYQDLPSDKLRILSERLLKVPADLGLGDWESTYSKTGYKAKDPLCQEVLDSYKGKVSLTLNLNFAPDAIAVEKTGRNLETLSQYWGDEYNVKPRGGRFIVNVTADPKATAVRSKVSKDGNTYDIVIPARVDASGLDQVFKAGM